MKRKILNIFILLLIIMLPNLYAESSSDEEVITFPKMIVPDPGFRIPDELVFTGRFLDKESKKGIANIVFELFAENILLTKGKTDNLGNFEISVPFKNFTFNTFNNIKKGKLRFIFYVWDIKYLELEYNKKPTIMDILKKSAYNQPSNPKIFNTDFFDKFITSSLSNLLVSNASKKGNKARIKLGTVESKYFFIFGKRPGIKMEFKAKYENNVILNNKWGGFCDNCSVSSQEAGLIDSRFENDVKLYRIKEYKGKEMTLAFTARYMPDNILESIETVKINDDVFPRGYKVKKGKIFLPKSDVERYCKNGDADKIEAVFERTFLFYNDEKLKDEIVYKGKENLPEVASIVYKLAKDEYYSKPDTEFKKQIEYENIFPFFKDYVKKQFKKIIQIEKGKISSLLKKEDKFKDSINKGTLKEIIFTFGALNHLYKKLNQFKLDALKFTKKDISSIPRRYEKTVENHLNRCAPENLLFKEKNHDSPGLNGKFDYIYCVQYKNENFWKGKRSETDRWIYPYNNDKYIFEDNKNISIDRDLIQKISDILQVINLRFNELLREKINYKGDIDLKSLFDRDDLNVSENILSKIPDLLGDNAFYKFDLKESSRTEFRYDIYAKSLFMVKREALIDFTSKILKSLSKIKIEKIYTKFNLNLKSPTLKDPGLGFFELLKKTSENLDSFRDELNNQKNNFPLDHEETSNVLMSDFCHKFLSNIKSKCFTILTLSLEGLRKQNLRRENIINYTRLGAAYIGMGAGIVMVLWPEGGTSWGGGLLIKGASALTDFALTAITLRDFKKILDQETHYYSFSNTATAKKYGFRISSKDKSNLTFDISWSAVDYIAQALGYIVERKFKFAQISKYNIKRLEKINLANDNLRKLNNRIKHLATEGDYFFIIKGTKPESLHKITDILINKKNSKYITKAEGLKLKTSSDGLLYYKNDSVTNKFLRDMKPEDFNSLDDEIVNAYNKALKEFDNKFPKKLEDRRKFYEKYLDKYGYRVDESGLVKFKDTGQSVTSDFDLHGLYKKDGDEIIQIDNVKAKELADQFNDKLGINIFRHASLDTYPKNYEMGISPPAMAIDNLGEIEYLRTRRDIIDYYFDKLKRDIRLDYKKKK